MLFATAGALALDATDFTGGVGGLPSTFAAAFAALITFVLAVRLPLLVLGELRNLARSGLARAPRTTAGSAAAAQGTARVVAARERLRRTAVDGHDVDGTQRRRGRGRARRAARRSARCRQSSQRVARAP